MNKRIILLFFIMLALLFSSCQVKRSDLPLPSSPTSMEDSPVPDTTASAAYPKMGDGALYYKPISFSDAIEKFNSATPVCLTALFPAEKGDGDYKRNSMYNEQFNMGPCSWRGWAYEAFVLSDDQMAAVERLGQRFVYAMYDVQSPGFVQYTGDGIAMRGDYTVDVIRELQRGWQQQVLSPALYQGLTDAGVEISWVPELYDYDYSLPFRTIVLAAGNAVLTPAAGGGPAYAVPVMLWDTSYTILTGIDLPTAQAQYREYLALHPDRRNYGSNQGDIFVWIIMEPGEDGSLAVTGWEYTFMYNGVADAVIYDKTGVRIVFFDRTDSLLDGYALEPLDFRNEEALTRRLYERGREFLDVLYTLQGSDMTDADFDGARAMMAPELRDHDGVQAFFAQYLENVQDQDIRMAPYYNEDPMDERIDSKGRTELYVQQPMQSLARLTKPGAPDLYMISFRWNYNGFSSNVEGASPDSDRPLETLDITDQEGMNQSSDLSVGPGHLAILTFVERDGQLQVVNWETRGR